MSGQLQNPVFQERNANTTAQRHLEKPMDEGWEAVLGLVPGTKQGWGAAPCAREWGQQAGDGISGTAK